MSHVRSCTDRGSSPGPRREAGEPENDELVLWIAIVAARAAPALRAGVFDAMEADDAMRLVEAI